MFCILLVAVASCWASPSSPCCASYHRDLLLEFYTQQPNFIQSLALKNTFHKSLNRDPQVNNFQNLTSSCLSKDASNFYEDPINSYYVNLLTDRQTPGEDITRLAEVTKRF